MSKNIAVYTSSSDALNSSFFQVANELGKIMVANNFGLVYGAGNVGLMGTLARAVMQAGGSVIGVIPKALYERNLALNEINQLIVTKDMRERKATMEQNADAFIALPGGFGTLEEILEILTLKQLKYHNKPIVLVNTNGCYNHLLKLFDYYYQNNFAKEISREMYYVTTSPEDAIDYIKTYQPREIVSKWYEKEK